MNRILIWDIPTRMFHWAFAASLTGALGIGFLVDDDHPLFQSHMVLGIVAIFLLVFRMAMGLVGSRHAKFSGFPLRPREVTVYLANALFSKIKRYPGNNPGSALAAVLMFLLVPLLFVSGIGLDGEFLEEAHETLAWALLAVIVLHLAGIVWHSVRHRENIALSMITGKKDGVPGDAIRSSHPAWGIGFLLAGGAWIVALFANHNPDTNSVRLPVVGINLQLGEHDSEANEHHERGSRRKHEEHDDD